MAIVFHGPGHSINDMMTPDLLQLPPEQMLVSLPPALRQGCAEHYTRHLAYADPQGRYSIMYLIWRPGQFSPVHGHHTWCAYRVLQGELSETHYQWNAIAERAQPLEQVIRQPGDIVTAMPGLQQIHRLGNAGAEVAISLHIYGVSAQHIATNINHIVQTME